VLSQWKPRECRCKLWYVPKFTAASRGPPSDSSASCGSRRRQTLSRRHCCSHSSLAASTFNVREGRRNIGLKLALITYFYCCCRQLQHYALRYYFFRDFIYFSVVETFCRVKSLHWLVWLAYVFSLNFLDASYATYVRTDRCWTFYPEVVRDSVVIVMVHVKKYEITMSKFVKVM